MRVFVVWGLSLRGYLSRNHNPKLHSDRLSLHWRLQVRPGSLSVIESSSGIFVLECAGGLWGREAENAALYLYRNALILASELIRPLAGPAPTSLTELSPDLLALIASFLPSEMVATGLLSASRQVLLELEQASYSRSAVLFKMGTKNCESAATRPCRCLF